MAIVTGIFEHSNHLRLKIGGGGKQKNCLLSSVMYCGFQILLNPFGDQILHHAIVSQKLQNTHTFVAKITIWISAHPNFVHFLGLLYISEKICTFHFLSQTGIGPLHCQSYARRSNMGKCHKLVLGLKFWSVYIFKSPLAATALSPFSISYLRKRDW